MRKKLLLALVIFLLFYSVPSAAQQGIFVNEVLASNNSILADSTGKFEDWIELFNSNTSPFTLDGYYLSNDINTPTKFRFTGGAKITANGYLLLWASNDSARGKNHLPFKVPAGGTGI